MIHNVYRTVAAGSRSELFRLVMLKHIEFQSKYLTENVIYPCFIPLVQLKCEALQNMDLDSEADQQQVSLLNSLSDYRKLLKQITASVTNTFIPTFEMDHEYLSALDEFVELTLVSHNVAFSQNLFADFCTSHYDLNQIGQVVCGLVMLKNPFVDLSDKRLLNSLVTHNLRLVNQLLEVPFSQQVLELLATHLKEMPTLVNIDSNLIEAVRSSHAYGHVVVLKYVDFNVTNEKMHFILSKITSNFIATEDANKNVLVHFSERVQEIGQDPRVMNISALRELVREGYHARVFVSKEILEELEHATVSSLSRGVLGLLSNTVQHQFFFSSSESLDVEYFAFSNPFTLTTKWIYFFKSYLQCLDLILNIGSLGRDDLMAILMAMKNIVECFHPDNSKVGGQIIEQALIEFLEERFFSETKQFS